MNSIALPPLIDAPPRLMTHLPARSVNRRWIWTAAVLGSAVLALALLAYEVTGFLRLNRDTRVLRDTLLGANPGSAADWKKVFECSVGRLTCYAIRTGISLFPLDPKAQLALHALEGGEVGVYQLSRSSEPIEGIGLLSGVDAAMAKRGWEPLVKVANRQQTVLIYTPQATKSSAGSIRVCMAVLQRNQLVITSARANPEPLVQLALATKNSDFRAPEFLTWQNQHHR